MIPKHPCAHIIWFDETDSTNLELRRRKGELENLSAIAAKAQSKGRGQGDHIWYSTAGSNLTFSILYRFPDGLTADSSIIVSCITALGIRDYLLDKRVSARIKWPNDIWVGDRKICGILIENILESSSIRESIVGIGLNLNETDWPEDLPNPVSLCELVPGYYFPERELPLLIEKIRLRFDLAATSEGRFSLQEEFEKYLFRLP